MFFTHRQELFLFRYNDETVALTSSNKNLVFENREYIADKYITRSKISNKSTESSAPEMVVTVSKDSRIVEWFKYTSPWREVELQVISVDLNDLNNFVYLWSGTILQASFKENKAELECFSKEQLLDLEMNRYKYQNTCNYTLGREGCTLDLNNLSHTTTITSIDPDGITFEVADVDGQADDWFLNGTMKFQNQQFMIKSQKGTTIKTLQMYVDIFVGATVVLTYGCNRLPDTCKHKFNNLENNGAFSFVPNRNPFKGELTD